MGREFVGVQGAVEGGAGALDFGRGFGLDPEDRVGDEGLFVAEFGAGFVFDEKAVVVDGLGA